MACAMRPSDQRPKKEWMNRYRSLFAGCALLAVSGAAAHADCAEDLASFTGEAGNTEGISKDGSLAPLQESGTPNPGTTGGAAPAPEGGQRRRPRLASRASARTGRIPRCKGRAPR
jgi:hypothetical protein